MKKVIKCALSLTLLLALSIIDCCEAFKYYTYDDYVKTNIGINVKLKAKNTGVEYNVNPDSTYLLGYYIGDIGTISITNFGAQDLSIHSVSSTDGNSFQITGTMPSKISRYESTEYKIIASNYLTNMLITIMNDSKIPEYKFSVNNAMN